MKSERSIKVSESIEQAVQALCMTLSSSYGPKGMDKMLMKDNNTIITNDGATIMGFYKTHPIHRILSSVSKTQDSNCGDGTTSVVLLIGCLMESLKKLKSVGIHPSKVVEALEISKKLAIEYIDNSKTKVGESEFLDVALTTLNSKIASKSMKMANVALESLKLSKKEEIRILKKVGGSIDDIELFKGILIPKGDTVIEKTAKVLILQFGLSAPKTNIESKIIINDYTLMEKFVKEEREYVINMIKKIKQTGANLLIIQKSLMRESCSELAQHFLKKLGISFVNNVDRKDIEFLCNSLNTKPVTDIDLLKEPLELEIENIREWMLLKNTGCTILVSGCDDMVVDEAERSLNDVLCVVKSLMNEPFIVAGGGSIETGISSLLDAYTGPHNLIVKEISAGFLGMPHLLAQNSGLYSVDVISNLKRNIGINKNLGISLRTSSISDMVNDDGVIQPALVTKSMITLAIETVQALVRIDDILPAVN